MYSTSPSTSRPINVSIQDSFTPENANTTKFTFLAWSASPYEGEELSAHWWPYPSLSHYSSEDGLPRGNSTEQLSRRHSTMEWSQLYRNSEDQAERLLGHNGAEKKERSASEGTGEKVRRVLKENQSGSIWSCSIPEEESNKDEARVEEAKEKASKSRRDDTVPLKKSSSQLTLGGRELHSSTKKPPRKAQSSASKKRLASAPQAQYGARPAGLQSRSQSLVDLQGLQTLQKFDEGIFGKKIRPVSQQSSMSGLSIGLGRSLEEMEMITQFEDNVGKAGAESCLEVEEGEYDRRDSVWEDVN